MRCAAPNIGSRKARLQFSTETKRALLDSIPVTKTLKREDGTEEQVPCITCLRDRALIGIMRYTFARVGAALQMNVEDYFTQGRCGRVRLHEKGGKEHEAQCHHTPE